MSATRFQRINAWTKGYWKEHFEMKDYEKHNPHGCDGTFAYWQYVNSWPPSKEESEGGCPDDTIRNRIRWVWEWKIAAPLGITAVKLYCLGLICAWTDQHDIVEEA